MYKSSRDGFIDYNDLATQSVPIAYTTWSARKLTNDGLWPQTFKTEKPQGVTELRNTATNQFDFSKLSIWDQVDIRVVFDLTTSATNQESLVYMNMAIWWWAYSIYDWSWYFKAAWTRPVWAVIKLYMWNTDTINLPSEIMFLSDANASIKVNWFYISAKRK